MDVEHHDLAREFPNLAESIDILAKDNPLFSRLYASYNQVTQTIEELENQGAPIDDYTFESMKMHRVKLKDMLYNLMLAFESGRQFR